MGGSKAPSIPDVPTFQASPTAGGDIQFLSDLGRSLAGGGFIPGRTSTVDLSFLNPLVSLNPEATRMAFDLATRDVTRLRDDAQRQIINDLESNNQLTSSVAVNRMASLNENFSRDISDIGASLYLADVERSMGNLQNLFGAGLNTLQSSAQLGLTDQSQRNQFNLENYSNQIARTMLSQPQQRGGFSGALMGAGGGALAGSMFGPWGMAIGAGLGAASGGFGSPQTGGSVFQGGATLGGLAAAGALNNKNIFSLMRAGTTGTGTPGGLV